MPSPTPDTPVPAQLVEDVDRWIEAEHADAAKYSNREVLDESGAWTLHRLVAKAFAQGFNDGSYIAERRTRNAYRREQEKELRARDAKGGDDD